VNLINKAAQDAADRKYKLPTEPGMCLAAARVVVERAFGWPSHDLYKRIVTERVEANKTGTPWAADAEKSFNSRGLTVPTYQSPRPGDLVFNKTSPPYGHVGVIVEHAGGLYVLENAQVKRGLHLYDAVNLCPLHLWGPITTIGRLPDAEVPDPTPTVSQMRVVVDRGPQPADLAVGDRQEIPQADGVTINYPRPDLLWITVNERGKTPATPLP